MGLPCGQLKERPLAIPYQDDNKEREVDTPRWLGFGQIGAGYRIRTKG
jgi:hypothetical protein